MPLPMAVKLLNGQQRSNYKGFHRAQGRILTYHYILFCPIMIVAFPPFEDHVPQTTAQLLR